MNLWIEYKIQIHSKTTKHTYTFIEMKEKSRKNWKMRGTKLVASLSLYTWNCRTRFFFTLLAALWNALFNKYHCHFNFVDILFVCVLLCLSITAISCRLYLLFISFTLLCMYQFASSLTYIDECTLYIALMTWYDIIYNKSIDLHIHAHIFIFECFSFLCSFLQTLLTRHFIITVLRFPSYSNDLHVYERWEICVRVSFTSNGIHLSNTYFDCKVRAQHSQWCGVFVVMFASSFCV